MTLTPPEHPTTPKIPLAVAEKDSSSSPASGSASISISPAPSLHSEASIHLPPGSLDTGSRLQHHQYVSGDRTITIISPGSTSSSGISESLSVTPNPGGKRHHHKGHHRKLSATFVTAAALTNVRIGRTRSDPVEYSMCCCLNDWPLVFFPLGKTVYWEISILETSLCCCVYSNSNFFS